MLSPEQRAAILDYSDSGYQRINRALRDGTVSRSLAKKVSILAAALNQLPDFRGDVFRGAQIDPDLLAPYQDVGNTIVEPAFISPSRSPSKAFLGNARFYILSKRGKEIHRWSAYRDEEEVLFPPGTKFKILEYSRDGDDIEIFLEEM
jgi:NAD:arginine ADP-ribosyltransferase